MQKDSWLKWEILSEQKMIHTPVYDVICQHERASNGMEGDYIATRARDWAVIIPVIGDNFLMVRQWRHAAQEITLEFPGGVCDAGENALESARRELEEETGFRAGKVRCLGSFSPNPALFCNRVHCYLAEDLTDTGKQHLDADELLDFLQVPISDVMKMMGNGEFDHALMACAMALYMKERML